MPKIYFFEGRESGIPDSSVTWEIPDQGELSVIPFEWDGKDPYQRKFKSSRMRRPAEDPEYRVFQAIFTDSKNIESSWTHNTDENVAIIWVEERGEWVAFKQTWKIYRTDNYGFRDEYVSLEGPWSLDGSHQQALLRAYYVLGDIAPLEPHKTPPEELQSLSQK